MDPFSDNDVPTTSAVLQTMVLLSTLTTASELRHALQERRAGRDPSTQETDEVVRPYMEVARLELQEMLMRLRASLAYAQHGHDDEMTAVVRRFDDLMTLTRAATLLQTVHQRLLSLYPHVSEALIEEARVLQRTSRKVIEAEDASYMARLAPFLEHALVFAARMKRELNG